MKMFYQNKYSWSPKFALPFSAIVFLVIIVFNKAEYKVRYLDWSLCVALVVTIIAFFLLRGRISKKILLVTSLPLIWTLYALLGSFFAVNIYMHLMGILGSVILSLFASALVISVFTREEYFPNVIMLVSLIWTAINLVFFCAWFAGIYVYERVDFAGLFQNRNEFAVQTVIITSMFFFFVKKFKLLKFLIIVLNGLMIASSLSTKGFIFFFFILFYPIFLSVKTYKKLLVLASGFLLLFFAIIAIPNIQERLDRFMLVFTKPTELRQSESAFLRSWLLVEGVQIVINKPTFGVGVNNSRLVLIPPYFQQKGMAEGLYSHNNFLEMALNGGLPSLLLFYLPLFLIYLKVHKTHKYYSEIKTFSMLYILLGMGMVQYNNFICIFLYSLILLLYYYYLNESNQNESNSVCCQYAGKNRAN